MGKAIFCRVLYMMGSRDSTTAIDNAIEFTIAKQLVLQLISNPVNILLTMKVNIIKIIYIQETQLKAI